MCLDLSRCPRHSNFTDVHGDVPLIFLALLLQKDECDFCQSSPGSLGSLARLAPAISLLKIPADVTQSMSFLSRQRQNKIAE